MREHRDGSTSNPQPPMRAPAANHGAISFERTGGSTLILRLSGTWRLEHGVPSPDTVQRELESPPHPRRITFDSRGLAAWGSALVAFLARVDEICSERSISIDRGGLPAGVKRLLELAETVPEKRDARGAAPAPRLLERIGAISIGYGQSIEDLLAFVGELSIAFANFVRGRARYRKSDLALTIQQCGANALGIVTLISFLVGAILAFMGSVQLSKFGASIYVANLVGIGMVREMGAMMAAIIMSGRTGAAFAAQLGSMKVTQEIDALTTMGLSPIEFLVLPRVIALVLMMPLLATYADLMGIMGGAAVGTGMLHLSFNIYLHSTRDSVSLTDFFGGLFKAGVYGVLIAIAGCLRGLQCGNSSSAVGDAATSAVVTGIVFVVSACGMFALIFNILGF